MSDNILQLNEAAIKGELKNLVKNSVEETLNALLNHEADEQLVNAERYERSGNRKGYRSGHYDRNFTTTAGDVTLQFLCRWKRHIFSAGLFIPDVCRRPDDVRCKRSSVIFLKMLLRSLHILKADVQKRNVTVSDQDIGKI